MKNFKNLVPLFAIVLGLGLVFTQSAFKSTTTGTVWVFDSNDIADAKDATKYHVDMEAPTCDLGETLPCKVISEGITSTDPNDFQDYLDNTYPTTQDVLENAEGVRDSK